METVSNLNVILNVTTIIETLLLMKVFELKCLLLLLMLLLFELYYYTSQEVRGPMTRINQSKCSIAGQIFSYSFGQAIVPNDPTLAGVPLNLKLRWWTRMESFGNFVVKLKDG